jgi:hypothetical protein
VKELVNVLRDAEAQRRRVDETAMGSASWIFLRWERLHDDLR